MKTAGTFLTAVMTAAFLCFLQGPVFAQEGPGSSLEVLIGEALRQNPRIQQAQHEWQAAQYRIDSAKGLPDPQLSYGYFGESIETRVGPQEQKFGVSQKVPFPGKLKYKGEIQAKKAQVLKQKYEALRNEVVKDVKVTYYELYWLDRALEINGEEKTILEDLEKTAQRKYESNLGPQQDIIKLQVELSGIIKRTALLRQNRKTMTARMNRLLNRQESMPVGAAAHMELVPFSYGLQEVLEMASDSRQDLVAAGLEVEKSELEKKLARMEYLPDFMLGYEYTEIGGGTTSSVNDGQDAWMGKISVEVPFWFGKIRSEVKAREEEIKAAQEKKEDAADLAAYEVQDMYFRIMTDREIVSLYETALVPQSQQAFDSYRTGFETGEVSFLDWLDAQRTYLQTRLAYYKAIADYQKSVAMLEQVVGKSLGGSNE